MVLTSHLNPLDVLQHNGILNTVAVTLAIKEPIMAKQSQLSRHAKDSLKSAKKQDLTSTLHCWTTPSSGLETNPAQRLHNRRTRTLLPTSAIQLQPRIPNDEIQEMRSCTNKNITTTNQPKNCHHFKKVMSLEHNLLLKVKNGPHHL